MTKKNILIGIAAAIHFVLPVSVNIALAGTAESTERVQPIPTVYTGNSSYADDAMDCDYVLE